uniref:Uncharacterized protein n=1 Tax=Arundo donax TaxID=35708 RepID=A0A0A9ELZ9_ARUDO
MVYDNGYFLSSIFVFKSYATSHFVICQIKKKERNKEE